MRVKTLLQKPRLHLENVKIYEFSGSKDLPTTRHESIQSDTTAIDFDTGVATESIYPPTGGFILPESIYDTSVYIYTSGTTAQFENELFTDIFFDFWGWFFSNCTLAIQKQRAFQLCAFAWWLSCHFGSIKFANPTCSIAPCHRRNFKSSWIPILKGG